MGGPDVPPVPFPSSRRPLASPVLYHRQPSILRRGAVFELTAAPDFFPDRMSWRTKLPGNSDCCRKLLPVLFVRVWAPSGLSSWSSQGNLKYRGTAHLWAYVADLFCTPFCKGFGFSSLLFGCPVFAVLSSWLEQRDRRLTFHLTDKRNISASPDLIWLMMDLGIAAWGFHNQWLDRWLGASLPVQSTISAHPCVLFIYLFFLRLTIISFDAGKSVWVPT